MINKIKKNIDYIIKSGINKKIYPGGVVLIGTPDEILYSKAYGTIDGNIKNTKNTIYDLASLTKVLATTMAIMVLLEEGKIHLNDKLEYFGIYDEKKDITLFNLLTHTSGIPAYSDLWEKYKNKNLYNKLLQIKPIYSPNSQILYSCINFILLMYVIEKITGKRFETYIESIYKNYGIKNLYFKPFKKTSLQIAPTSIRNNKRLLGKPDDELSYYLNGISGNAGLFGNVFGIYDLLSKLLQGKIVSKNIFYLFVNTTVKLKDSKKHLGWMAPTFNSSAGDILNLYNNAYGHTGFTGTSIWGYDYLFVILLTNRTYYERFGKTIEEIKRIRIILNNIIFGGLL